MNNKNTNHDSNNEPSKNETEKDESKNQPPFETIDWIEYLASLGQKSIKVTAIALGLAFASNVQTAHASNVHESLFNQFKGDIDKDPVLSRIKKNHKIVIGVRKSSPPVSFKDKDGKYVGLAVDICKDFVKDLSKIIPSATGGELPIEYVEVDSKNRMDKVKNGEIDIECGSTTHNFKREADVKFSAPYYVAYIKAIALKDSKVQSVTGMRSGNLIFTKGTTTKDAIIQASNSIKYNIKNFTQVEGTDHQDSFNKLTDGKGDVFMNDDAILYGLIQQSKNPSNYKFLPEVFSIEPYAVMTNKKSRINLLVTQTIIDEINDKRYYDLWKKWLGEKPIDDILNQNLKECAGYDYQACLAVGN